MSIVEQLLAQETAIYPSSRQRAWFREASWHRVPGTLKEQEFNSEKLDKAFACEWEDTNHVLVGTKCNKLLQLDTATGTSRSIPLPTAPPRRRAPYDHEWGHCGIHGLALSPSRDWLAVGGENPADVAILDRGTWRPVATLVGHLDWVFGVAWVSDRHVVTAGRDQSVALWSIPDVDDDEDEELGSPLLGGVYLGKPSSIWGKVVTKDWTRRGDFRKAFQGKVRDVKYEPMTASVATLSLEGAVRLHDPGMGLAPIRKIRLPIESHRDELACLALTPGFCAVGRQADVVLVDPRSRSPAPFAVIESPDASVGVRSVAVQGGSLLSFGTAAGRLCFHDLRQGRGSTHNDTRSGAPLLWPASSLMRVADTGAGWVDQNETYWDHFAHSRVPHACYAHAWDACGSRLFACGGPLAFGMRGCYLGLWH